jgi:hypothetical protein
VKIPHWTSFTCRDAYQALQAKGIKLTAAVA